METNIFISFSNDLDSTMDRCKYAFIIRGFLFNINHMLLSIIFLHRIYIIFKNSMFAYKTWVYCTLLIWILIFPILFYLPYTPALANMTVILVQDRFTNLAFCASDIDRMDQIVIASQVIVSQTISATALLILFIRGLCTLNTQRIVHFLRYSDEQCTVQVSQPTTSSISLPDESHFDKRERGTTSTESVDTPTTDVASDAATDTATDTATNTPTKPAASVATAVEYWENRSTFKRKQSRHELERIVKLHNLIKKQTVLVCTAMISKIILHTGICLDTRIGTQIGWDMVLNAVCVWMMLHTSDRYWNICKKYGVCVCCYWKTNKMGM